MERARTDWEKTVFAAQPGLATERFGKPRSSTEDLASERMMGVRPLGQVLKAVVNGQVMEFLRSGPLLMLENNQLKIPSLVSQALPQADLKTGKQKRIQDFASAVHQDWLVIGPLTQLVFLGVAPDQHLHLVNFFPAANGQPAFLLFRPAANGQGQLAISAPGGFSVS
jgi:hypothetical protein